MQGGGLKWKRESTEEGVIIPMKPSLLILAAGVGSRYGGLKQMDTFGPAGETIIDYSIYDAMQAGFNKIVFVIRKSMEDDFRGFFSGRFAAELEIEFVFQELDQIPHGYQVPAERVKPWGTGHAVMIAAEKIREPFLIINADDYYGAGSYRLAYDFLSDLDPARSTYCIIGYQVSKTLSEHGYVSRAVCEADPAGNPKGLVERTQIFRHDGKIVYRDQSGDLISVGEDVIVSMNMMGFTPTFFPHLENAFDEFIPQGINDLKAELFLPNVVGDLVKAKKATVQILATDERWFGVTYKEDKEIVSGRINDLVGAGKYPSPLWGK